MANYKILVGTGLIWPHPEIVEAENEQDAVDLVADKLEAEESGFVQDYYTIQELCESGEVVYNYADAHNLVCCGNHGLYMEVVGIDVID